MDSKGLVLFVVLAVVFLGGNVLLIYAHEEAHRHILSYYGIGSEVKFDLLGVRTIATEDIDEEDLSFVMGLNALNEVVGYQVVALFNAVFLCLFVMLMLFWDALYKEGGRK